MSLSRSQKSRLGLFMLLGAFLLVVFIAIPVGFKFAEREKTYYAVFTGESLSGLDQGAIVKYYGVPIGKVDRVTFDPKDIERVRVEIRIRHDFPMKKGMYIQTGMLGITGLKYVEVMGGSNDAPVLKPGSEVPVKPSLMATLTGKTDVIISKVELLLNHINAIAHPDSIAPVKEIIKNAADISREINDFMQASTPKFKSIAGSAESTMRKVDLIASDVKSITANVNATVNAADLSRTVADIDSTVRTLNSLTRNLDLTVRQSREDFTVALENLRETLENANELSKILSENPSLLLRGDTKKQRDLR
ncbi:MAG: MCE family protein [Chitinivibrionales bacterium]|nr:MCE family protein [Chitinivibrionales bacterium]MBD3394657.1 MCE family protein [Chitinivibrionales bacterium]